MQVRLVAEPADLHIVAAAVVAITSMKRLMDVAHDVHDELESECLLLARRVRIAHGLREPRQRTQSIAFFGRADLGIGLAFGHRDVVVGASFALPEHARVRTFLVCPGRGLRQIFLDEDQFDLGAGLPADMLLRNLPDDPVSGLSPRVGDGGNDKGNCGNQCGSSAEHGISSSGLAHSQC